MGIINYYTSGITANGYVTLLSDNLKDIEKTFLITGEIRYKNLYDKLVLLWERNHCNLEYIHNPLFKGSLEAIINRVANTAIVFNYNPLMPAVYDIDLFKTYNLGKCIDLDSYNKQKDTIIQLKHSSFACMESAYLYFARALKVHDEWERIYIQNMNFSKTEQLAEDYKRLLIGDNKAAKKPIEKHRFLGAATPEGARDFIPNLTANIGKRYFIKGRPGTGKSTFLKRIANYALSKGFDTEIYHCGFDHNSLDMVILRELDLCLFDSTPPHEHFPDRETDEVIDIYQIAVSEGTDERYYLELDEIKKKYRLNINVATAYLKNLSVINDTLLDYYDSMYNQPELEDLYNHIVNTINN